MFVGIDLTSKKLWAAVAAIAVGSSLGLGTVWSYLKTGHRMIGQTIRENVPVELEIERLGQLIDDAEQQLRQDERQLAMMEVQCETLREEIAQGEQQLRTARKEMDQLASLLELQTGDRITIGDRQYARIEVEQELQRRLDAYDFLQSSLDDRRKALAERQEYLARTRQAIEENRREVQKLALQREALRDQQQMLKVDPNTDPNFDSHKVAQAKQLAEELLARLRAEEKARQIQLAKHRIELPKDEDSPLERYRKRFSQDSPSHRVPQPPAAQ